MGCFSNKPSTDPAAESPGHRQQGSGSWEARGPACEACRSLFGAWPPCIVPAPLCASCRLLSVCCAGSSTQRQQFACTKRLHCFGNIRFCVDCCSSSCALKSVRSVCCALSARLQHRIGSERSSPAHPFPGDVVFLLCTFAEYENFLQLKFCIIGKIPAVLYQCCDHSFIQFFMQITHSL